MHICLCAETMYDDRVALSPFAEIIFIVIIGRRPCIVSNSYFLFYVIFVRYIREQSFCFFFVFFLIGVVKNLSKSIRVRVFMLFRWYRKCFSSHVSNIHFFFYCSMFKKVIISKIKKKKNCVSIKYNTAGCPTKITKKKKM